MLADGRPVMPVAAQAQTVEGERPGVGEIIVTAQRRAESLTEVPLSIAAATSEAFQSKGLESITDLRFETPDFISLSGTGYTQLYVRGIGNNIFVGADPSDTEYTIFGTSNSLGTLLTPAPPRVIGGTIELKF